MLVQDLTLCILSGTTTSDLRACDRSEATNSSSEESQVLARVDRSDIHRVFERLEQSFRMLRNSGDDDVSIGLDAASVVITVDLRRSENE